MGNLTGQDRRFLHRFLTERFSLSELKTLAYYESYPFEDYPHSTISDMAREMLQYFEREDRLGAFVYAVLQERPDDELARIYAALPLPEKSARVKLELIIRNAGRENAQEIRDRIARAMGWQAEDVGIIMAVAGSVRLLLSVPADKAADLLALARGPQAWGPYEVVSAIPYEQLSEADRAAWRKRVTGQPLTGAPPVEPVVVGKGLPFVVRLLLVLLILAGVAATAVFLWNRWNNQQPRLTVVNQCTTPLDIPAPAAVKSILSLPDSIAPGESLRLTMLTGPGRYELILNDNDVLILRLPRPLPGVDLTEVALGRLDDDDLAVRLNGRLLTPPQSFQIEPGQTYDLIICAPR
jgi:hypothetical protein